jgi:hypothetical protein
MVIALTPDRTRRTAAPRDTALMLTNLHEPPFTEPHGPMANHVDMCR